MEGSSCPQTFGVITKEETGKEMNPEELTATLSQRKFCYLQHVLVLLSHQQEVGMDRQTVAGGVTRAQMLRGPLTNQKLAVVTGP